MTYLREIMQKLAAGHSKLSRDRCEPSSASSVAQKASLDEYCNRLASCTAGMLQYEWAWLKEHIEALELCVCQPQMCQEMGGVAHAERLLEETRKQRLALEELLHKRGIGAPTHRHGIHPGEHAWEVRNETMKRNWGMV